MTVNELIDYLEQVRGELGGDTQVVLVTEDWTDTEGAWVCLEQIPGLEAR